MDMVHRRSRPPSREAEIADAVATGLGWFSLGLGLTELAAPRVITRALGMQGCERLVRSYGVREIAAGVGILASTGRSRALWMWARVGGDALDIATVAATLNRPRAPRGNIGAALAALTGVALVDAYCAQRLSASPRPPRFDERRRPAPQRPAGPRAA